MDFSQYVNGDILNLSGQSRLKIAQLIIFLQSNTNIKRLSLSNCSIGDRDAKALAESENLKNLTTLHLDLNNIGDEGAEALANSPYLTNLKKLDLRSNKIGGKGVEALARPRVSEIILYGGKKLFYEFLSEKHSNNQAIDEKSIKKMIFSVAQLLHDDGRDSIVKCILTQPDKYPFLINSQDEQEHTLSHFFTHNATMQKFLFEHGFIPREERDAVLQNILQNGESVHISSIAKRTSFFTQKLVESTKASKEQLKRAVDSYVKDIELLKQYQDNPMKLRLLSLSDGDKRSVMEHTPSNDGPIPNDEEFIRTVIDKAQQALAQQYLKKNRNGEYDQGYPTQELQYDYTRDDAKITIPESIGYIKLLIDNFPIPLKERKELLATLMEQNPNLVKEKLSVIKRELGDNRIFNKGKFEKTELHELLNGIDDDEKVNKLFKEISSLDIEKVWKEQKEFVLLKQVYIAATTHGESSSACSQGVWTQIISSIDEISSEILTQYNRYLEEEHKQEMQKSFITEENIKPFMEGLANKLIQHVELHPELKETLEDFAVYNVDIDRPKEITFEQQKILAEINKYFSENINGILHNYDRSIPKRDEYNLIIEGLPEVGVMQNFMKVNPEVSNQQEISVSASQKNNNSQQSSDATQRIEKRSKLPIITASAGLLLGLGIAYFAGAATLTPVGVVVAVFLAAAVGGALVGYGVGKFYEKVSSKLSDVSTGNSELEILA